MAQSYNHDAITVLDDNHAQVNNLWICFYQYQYCQFMKIFGLFLSINLIFFYSLVKASGLTSLFFTPIQLF